MQSRGFDPVRPEVQWHIVHDRVTPLYTAVEAASSVFAFYVFPRKFPPSQGHFISCVATACRLRSDRDAAADPLARCADCVAIRLNRNMSRFPIRSRKRSV
jgi:hypothetical protein